MRAILVMGTTKQRKSLRSNSRKREKMTEPKGLEMMNAPEGRFHTQQARYYVGANCDFTHSTMLGRGRCPYNTELRKTEKENKKK